MTLDDYIEMNHNNLQFFLNSISEVLLWKDTSSIFKMANNNALRLFGYKECTNLLGKNDYELKGNVSELADKFIQYDHKVVTQDTSLKILGLYDYPTTIKLFLINQSPIKHAGMVLGTAIHAIDITNSNLINITNSIVKIDNKRFSPKKNNQFCYLLENTFLNYKLSGREFQCLFYLVRGKSMKEISRILCISSRTVESYIENLKLKMLCQSKSQLIEKAISLNFLDMLPMGSIEESPEFGLLT